MKLIVGLGNPGQEYSKTRHNTGWMFIDYIAGNYNVDVTKEKFNALIGEKNIDGEKVVFAKPLTFMNLSGNAVSKLKNWYKVENKDIMIIFDDVDIPFGTFRYREKGSGGSHNGMKDIVEKLSTKDIPRIRIGIGGLKYEKQDMADFVLENYKKNELDELQDVFNDVQKEIDKFIHE